jgi:uncharacterized protein
VDKSKAIGKVVLFCFVFLSLFVALSFFKSLIPGQFERFAHGIIGTIAALLSTYLFLRFDRKSFADVNLKWEKKTLTKFFMGFGVGIAITTLMFSSLIFFGNMRLELNQSHNVGTFLLATLAFIPLALMEEIAFRAYPLVTLTNKLSIRTSLVVTAILFAIYHIANGWSIHISFLGPGVWGLVYGLSAVYSNGIAMPTGMHYATNLTQAAIGMGKGFTPIWTLQEDEQLSSANNNEWIGVAIQIILLVVTLLSIQWYQKHAPKQE